MPVIPCWCNSQGLWNNHVSLRLLDMSPRILDVPGEGPVSLPFVEYAQCSAESQAIGRCAKSMTLASPALIPGNFVDSSAPAPNLRNCFPDADIIPLRQAKPVSEDWMNELS
jgi:hypothetical protein